MKPHVTMVGNLTSDVTATFANGDGSAKRCLFTIACNSTYIKDVPDGDGEKVKSVDFIPCIAWNGLVDVLKKWGLKGRKVHIVGTLEAYQPPVNEATGVYPQTKVQVRAEHIEFCGFEDNVKAKLEAKKAKTPAQAQTPALSQADILAALAKVLAGQPAQPAQTPDDDVAF